MPNVTALMKWFPVTCLILAGCTRDLPKPDKKVAPPKVEAPVESRTRPAGKKLPDDPNRTLPPTQVEAHPEVLADPELGKKPDVGMTDGNGRRQGGSNGNSGVTSPNDTMASKKSKIHWDEIIKKVDLLNPQKTQGRLSAVKALIGEKADSEIARWQKSEKLHKLFMGFRFEVLEKGDKLQIAYSFFTPTEKDEAGNRVFEVPLLSQELTPQELEEGAVLHLQGANEEGVQAIAKQFGKVAVFKLKNSNDFLLTHERADDLGLGLVFHQDKKEFGAIAPLVQEVGGEERVADDLKDFNIVGFIEIGRRKLNQQLDPLIAVFEKLPALIAASPQIDTSKFVEYGNFMYENLIRGKVKGKDEDGFLLRLKDYTTASFERVLTVRIKEMEEAGKYIPINDSLATLVGIYKKSVLETFTFITEQKGEAVKWLESFKAEKPEVNIEPLMQALATAVVDESEISLALDYMGREILESIVIDPGKAKAGSNPKPPANPPAPAAK